MRSRMILLLGFFVAALLCGNEVQAQRGLRGQIGVGVSMGTTDGFLLRGRHADYRFWCGVDVVRYNRNHSYWNFGAEVLRKDYIYRGYVGRENVPVAQITGEAGYNVPLVSDRGRNVALTCGVAALLGYETSGWGDKRLRDGATLLSQDTFLYGGALSATLEGYLSDRIVLFVRVRERCLPSSPTGVFHTQVGFGFRLIIN